MGRFFVLFMSILVGFVAVYIFATNLDTLHITASFEELEPFNKQLNVYYKGFKLGHSTKVYPSKDFLHTNVRMVLKNAHTLQLPDNTTAKIRTKNKKDYIELVYPTAPSITYLKNNSIIEGQKGINFSNFLQDKADSGGLDEITNNLSDTVASAGQTLDSLTELFKTANEILIDLKPALHESGVNIAKTTQNLTETTENLANVSRELNISATKPKRLDNTFANIELITSNLAQTTLNTATLTQRTDKETVELINCVIRNINVVVGNVNVVVKNVNDIVKGFQTTLSKRFAGMRVLVGSPLRDK